MSLPALTRGLILLEELIKTPGGMRYSDLKGAIPGVGDASLNRLLTSLIESSHIKKKSGLYYPSSRVNQWFEGEDKQKNFKEKVTVLIESLVDRTGESAGFCIYRKKKLIILHSLSCPDSISIIKPGETLHFEGDHAASLAVLDLMTEQEREEAINSPFSRTTESEWSAGKMQFHRQFYYADLSRLREGISRLALPWQSQSVRGALFLCLPTIRMELREKRLARIMQEELNKYLG